VRVRMAWVCREMGFHRCVIRRRTENILRWVGQRAATKPALTNQGIIMPVASSSRRRTRITKQSSSDRIEEDNPTQQGEDVDGDEEEQPKQSTKRAKGKARATSRGALQQETVGGEDDVEEDENDYKNLPDQPLSKSDAAKLKGLALDWSQIRKGIHQPSFNQLRDIAIALADTTEGDEAEGVSIFVCFFTLQSVISFLGSGRT
jgi:hypothetical protein